MLFRIMVGEAFWKGPTGKKIRVTLDCWTLPTYQGTDSPAFPTLTFNSDTMHSAHFGGLFALRRQKNVKKGSSLKGLYENNRC